MGIMKRSLNIYLKNNFTWFVCTIPKFRYHQPIKYIFKFPYIMLFIICDGALYVPVHKIYTCSIQFLESVVLVVVGACGSGGDQ